jgi:aspartate aminotransferase
MTGWRIGWACGPAKLITAMADIQSQSTSNPTSIAQVAAEAALAGDQQCVTEMVTAFKARHDALVTDLNTVPGVKCLAGDGTFYVFPNVEGLMQKLGCKTDLELSNLLLEKHLVAVVPGSAFGAPGHLRLSFATSDKVLKGSVERLRAAAQG